jgi:hypothetical protein
VVFLGLFHQCGIFGIVPPVWYFWDCSTSVVFLGLFHQCGIFGIVPPVWYFWDCSTSVVFTVCFSFYYALIPHWWNNPKNTTLVEQSQKYHTGGTIPKIPHW